MRIGIDCRLWDESGVGRYIRNLVIELSKFDKNNQYILFVLDAEKFKAQSSKFKIKAKIVTANIHWHSMEEQLLFAEIINKEQVDLMHFPYFSVPYLYNQPFVVTIHDLIINYFPTGKASTLALPLYYAKRFAYQKILQHAIHKSQAIIVPLNAVKDDVVRMFPNAEKKVFVTKEGIEAKSEGQRAQSKESLEKKKYFLHVGNVYPHKNCEKLVHAFAIVLKDNPEFELIFVGKEDYFIQKLKEHIAMKGLSKNVHFVGKVNDEELNAYYRHAMALVIPSLMEGFGLPAIEAMSQSCLVLASDIPSLREVCDNAALFFNPQNSEAIAKTMEKAIQLPTNQIKAIRLDGMKVSKQFSWEKMCQETIAIYESSIGIRSGK